MGAAAQLQELLGLDDQELLDVLGTDPLALLSGEADLLPEVPVLVGLVREAEERAGGPVLRRWVRATGPAGRPLDLLLRRDFAAFEDALGVLAERGLILRSTEERPAPHDLAGAAWAPAGVRRRLPSRPDPGASHRASYP